MTRILRDEGEIDVVWGGDKEREGWQRADEIAAAEASLAELRNSQPRILTEDETGALVTERGAVYGDPKDDFARVARMAQAIEACADPLAKHVLYMLLVKISRLVHSPNHLDSWKDIAGYARCGEQVTR